MSKFNLIKIHTWSVSLKCGIILATILFILIGGYFFYLKSILVKKNDIYSQLKYLEMKIKKQQSILEECSVCQKKMGELKKRCLFYNDNYSNTILLLLTGQLLTQNFTIKDLKILAIKKKKFLHEIWFKVRLLNVNNNITEFLYQIENLQYLILLENFRWNFFDALSASSTAQKEIEFLFHVYYYATEIDIFNLGVSNLNKISAKYSSLFKKNILIKYPLNTLKMVGFLSEDHGERNWGLIRLPNTQIYKLELGDSIGLEQGLVMAITPKKIFVQRKDLNKIIELSMKTGKFRHVMALSG
jgi:Tfp pilus assembly protein PilO